MQRLGRCRFLIPKTVPDYTVGIFKRCLADFLSAVKCGRGWILLTLHVDDSVVATDVFKRNKQEKGFRLLCTSLSFLCESVVLGV